MQSSEKFYVELFSKSKEGGTKTGIKVEMEHTSDKKRAKKIAEDHLAEDKDYYDDWKNKEKILFQDKAPKIKKAISDKLMKLYKRKVDSSLPDAPSFEEWRAGLKKGSEVASIAVIHDDKILMMQRRDNDRWTTPGEHIDEGEKPDDAAKRELKEEAGVEANKVKKIDTKQITSFTGKDMKIHAYIYEPKNKPKVTAKNDPDNEAKKFKWVSVKDFPQDIKDNLHSPQNVVLQKLGILKSLFDKGFDLVKSRTHKYIRKYKRGDKWIYVYFEGKNEPTHIDEEAIGHIKKLAELGNVDAKMLHEGIIEYAEEKLRLLRELHAIGNVDAKRTMKEMGLKEEDFVHQASQEKDDIDQKLSPAHHLMVKNAIDNALKTKIFDYLSSHKSTPFGRALVASQGEDFNAARARIVNAVAEKKTIKEMLTEFHTQLNSIDAGMPNHATSSNNDVKTKGGYANVAYAEAIKGIEGVGLLPQGYGEVHKRQANLTNHEVQPVQAIKDKLRIKREEEEARSREAIGRQAANVSWLETYHNKNFSTEEKAKLARGISKVFGDDWSMENWVNSVQHSDERIKTRIEFDLRTLMGYADARPNTDLALSFNYNIKEGSNTIMQASRTFTRKSNGSMHVYNGSLSRPPAAAQAKYPNMATALYTGTEKMLRDSSANLPDEAKKKTHITIGTCANGGFGNGYKGAIVWAKHRYDFEDENTANSWKSGYNSLLDEYAPRMGISNETKQALKSAIATFKYPYQFVEMGYGLTTQQMEAVDKIDDDIRKIVAKKGHYDIGSWLMQAFNRSWTAKNYVNGGNERSDHLNTSRSAYRASIGRERPVTMTQTEAIPARTSSPARTTSSPTRSTGPPARTLESERVNRYLRYWAPPAGRSNYTITEARLRILRGWSDEDVNTFLRTAPLTRDARGRVREILRTRSSST